MLSGRLREDHATALQIALEIIRSSESKHKQRGGNKMIPQKLHSGINLTLHIGLHLVNNSGEWGTKWSRLKIFFFIGFQRSLQNSNTFLKSNLRRSNNQARIHDLHEGKVREEWNASL